MNSRIRKFLQHPWLVQLALCVLLLHALVPAGFMPAVASDGSVTLQLCSAANPHSRQQQNHQQPQVPGQPGTQSDDTAQGACPFGGMLHAVLPVIVPQHLRFDVGIALLDPDYDSPVTLAPTPHSRLPRGPPFLN